MYATVVNLLEKACFCSAKFDKLYENPSTPPEFGCRISVVHGIKVGKWALDVGRNAL